MAIPNENQKRIELTLKKDNLADDRKRASHNTPLPSLEATGCKER